MRYFIPFIILSLAGCATPDGFNLGEDTNAKIRLNGEADFLRLAAEDLAGDIEKITGGRPPMLQGEGEDCFPCIVLTTSNQADLAEEQFFLSVDPDSIIITGGGDRGLMHGIYYFTEHVLGVDPLYFWSGIEPEPRPDLVLESMEYTSDEPDFLFRGWFINDEDLMTEWLESGGERNIRYRYYSDVVNTEAMAEVAEAAVRLRYNLIIPASFLDIGNPPERALVEEAARRGLYVSMHHIEPLGVSSFTYENYWAERGEQPVFSYYSEPEKVAEVWRHYAELWSEYPNVIWQVGLRGIGDRPMWMADPGVPQSNEERGGIISDAIAKQLEILREVTGESDPLMTTTLWAEGAYLFERGFLDIPENVITVFADNNSGWSWQSDFYDTERVPERDYGVYYHHQLWGTGPHLAQAIPPWQTEKVMRAAYKNDAHDYAIMNVSNIREFLPGLAASSKMLWDMEEFDARTFLTDWTEKRFGDAGPLAEDAYTAYFDGYAYFGPQQIPGFLDGQSRGKGLQILRRIEKIAREGYDPKGTNSQSSEELDPFYAALRAAKGVGDTPWDTLVAGLNQQLIDFERADSLTSLALAELSGAPHQLLTDNLQTHIRIQLAIGRWLQQIIVAERDLQQGEVQSARDRLSSAVDHLATAQEAMATSSTGRWENWYRGDRKMNLQQVGEDTEATLALLSDGD